MSLWKNDKFFIESAHSVIKNTEDLEVSSIKKNTPVTQMTGVFS